MAHKSMQVWTGFYYQFLENLSTGKTALVAQLLDTDHKSYRENFLGVLSVIIGITGEVRTTSQTQE